VHEDPVPAVTRPLRVPTQTFVAVCAIAGALAVPMNAVASPVSTLVAGLAGFLGLCVWHWSGLPGAMKTRPPDEFERVVRSAASLGIGLIIGLLLLAVIRLAVEPSVPAAGARIAAAATLPMWRRAVIIYVAAVGEEIVFRLLLLSAVTGLTMRLLRRTARVPSRGVVWVAIGLSATAFAAIHLPAWRAAGAMSIGLALIVLTLNGSGGIVFGYVFVTRGIMAAILAHAGADCAIQLTGPLTR
jgi:hypothetical protein